MIFKDLGLSNHTLWADVNVCAESPEVYGLYANQRGLFNVEDSSTEIVFPVCNPNHTLSTTSLISLFHQLGNRLFSLPTQEDFIVLRNECEWKWCKNGYRVISHHNGATLFLPAAGWFDLKGEERFNKITARYDAGLISYTTLQRHLEYLEHSYHPGTGMHGLYLTRTCDTKWAPLGWTGGAFALQFDESSIAVKPVHRNCCLSVRLVAKRM